MDGEHWWKEYHLPLRDPMALHTAMWLIYSPFILDGVCFFVLSCVLDFGVFGHPQVVSFSYT